MFKKILVPIDLEHENAGSRVLPAAKKLAIDNGAEIALVHVMPTIPGFIAKDVPAGYERRVAEDTKLELKALADKYSVPGDVQIHVAQGGVYPKIIECASGIRGRLRQSVKSYVKVKAAVHAARSESRQRAHSDRCCKVYKWQLSGILTRLKTLKVPVATPI